MSRYVLIYLSAVNLIAFFIMFYDKRCAIRRKMRVPELELFIFALIGGSAGSVLGMYIFHHKTRKPVFKYGMPAILLIQAAALIWCVR